MTSTKKSARSKLKCKLLWGQKSLGTKDTEEVKTDTTWAFQYSLETLGLVVINVKAGNKSLILDGYSEESGTKISESLLRRRYRYCTAFSIIFPRLFSLCPLDVVEITTPFLQRDLPRVRILLLPASDGPIQDLHSSEPNSHRHSNRHSLLWP